MELIKQYREFAGPMQPVDVPRMSQILDTLWAVSGKDRQVTDFLIDLPIPDRKWGVRWAEANTRLGIEWYDLKRKRDQLLGSMGAAALACNARRAVGKERSPGGRPYARALAEMRIHGEETGSAAVELAFAPDPNLRAQAGRWVAAAYDGVDPALQRRWASEVAIDRARAGALIASNPVACLQGLSAMLQSADPQHRRLALIGLADAWPHPEHFGWYKKWAQDPVPVQAPDPGAIRARAWLRGERAGELLRRHLLDPDPTAAALAAFAGMVCAGSDLPLHEAWRDAAAAQDPVQAYWAQEALLRSRRPDLRALQILAERQAPEEWSGHQEIPDWQRRVGQVLAQVRENPVDWAALEPASLQNEIIRMEALRLYLRSLPQGEAREQPALEMARARAARVIALGIDQQFLFMGWTGDSVQRFGAALLPELEEELLWESGIWFGPDSHMERAAVLKGCGAAAVPALTQALLYSYSPAAHYAEAALAELGPCARPALPVLLQSWRTWTRARNASADDLVDICYGPSLAAQFAEECGDELRQLLIDGNPYAQFRAADALRRVEPDPVRRQLLIRIRDRAKEQLEQGW
ncbi:MAG: hypothetical protein R3F17_04040 [Planctomycetota bacterium]